jgi:hypothetical protein
MPRHVEQHASILSFVAQGAWIKLSANLPAANVSDMPITLGLRADALELADPGTAEGVPGDFTPTNLSASVRFITFRTTGGNLIKIKSRKSVPTQIGDRASLVSRLTP